MVVALTSGALAKLYQGKEASEPLLQVLDYTSEVSLLKHENYWVNSEKLYKNLGSGNHC